MRSGTCASPGGPRGARKERGAVSTRPYRHTVDPLLISLHLVDSENAWLLDHVVDDVFDEKVDAELLRAFLGNPANLLVVAVAEGEVIGMASGICYVHPDKPLALFVNEVGVSERYQRQGIGRRLVTRLLERGRELGCREAWVATEVDNAPARALYDGLGGVEDPAHAVVYTWDLSDPATGS